MNDFAKRWVAALRSGEYKQGRTYLNVNNEFCVLGVACHLMRDKLRVNELDGGIVKYNGHSTVLPLQVQNALGLTSSLGYYSGTLVTLASASDYGVPFTVIADLIEQHQGELFHVSPVAESVTDIQADSNLS